MRQPMSMDDLASAIDRLSAEVAVLNSYVAPLPPAHVDWDAVKQRATNLAPSGFLPPPAVSPKDQVSSVLDNLRRAVEARKG